MFFIAGTEKVRLDFTIAHLAKYLVRLHLDKMGVFEHL